MKGGGVRLRRYIYIEKEAVRVPCRRVHGGGGVGGGGWGLTPFPLGIFFVNPPPFVFFFFFFNN